MDADMLRNSVTVLVFLILISGGCDLLNGDGVVNRTDREASEPFSYDVTLQNQSTFQIEAVNGYIEIVGVTGTSSVSIAGVKRVGSESVRDAEEHLENLEVRVTQSENNIIVETVQPQNTGGRSYIVDYEIRVPDHLQGVVLEVNGGITIEGMRAGLDAELVNGEVELFRMEGNTEVTVVNGSITSEIAMPIGGSLVQSIVNGQILLTIPDTTSADFTARIDNGTITLSGLTLSDQTVGDELVTGRLGSGEGTILLTVTNGEIEVIGSGSD